MAKDLGKKNKDKPSKGGKKRSRKNQSQDSENEDEFGAKNKLDNSSFLWFSLVSVHKTNFVIDFDFN